MGWFYEQIEQRKRNDAQVFSEAFDALADAVTGARRSTGAQGARDRSAMEEILKFYRVNSREIPGEIQGQEQQLEYLMRPHGIMRRTVRLEKGWYRDAIGPMLGTRVSDGSLVALIPGKISGYTFLDGMTGKQIRVNRKNQSLFREEATAFYKPFPLKKLGIPGLLRYLADALSAADFILVGGVTFLVTLVGMLSPKLYHLLTGPVLESGSPELLGTLACFMVGVSISRLLLNTAKSMIMARVRTKMDITVQAATMARLLSLPADFFQDYSAGELSSRARNIETLCEMLVSTILSTGLTSLFSLVYIGQIFHYAPALLVPALTVTLLTAAFSVITTLFRLRISRQQMQLGARESGMSYALISGVQKIKLAGAEKRSFARWGKLLAQVARLQYNPPWFLKYNGAMTLLISLAGQLAMYYGAVRSGMGVADYYAFNTAYAMVSGAFLSLTAITSTAARIRPVLEMAKPILETVPEIAQEKPVVTRLSGGIELTNVSFRYREGMPNVLDDLSLKIRPGQYIAIVGPTGCGKSTLMRLLLGFETPQKGAVYYDGRDLAATDLKSLRQKIGVVMQNGKLFSGDIYHNISISAPGLTMEDAWQAAELAGIAQDIRQMPMGMHTMISEGSGGVSGGQRQRLMIARAVAPKPRILMFDEATSALDNITQKKVSQSLDSLKCTRIVIAHRLSTIRHCDRILYLEGGKIVEDGTYAQLLEQNGRFAQLVARQRLDTGNREY